MLIVYCVIVQVHGLWFLAHHQLWTLTKTPLRNPNVSMSHEVLQLWFCRISPFTGGVNVGECKLKALYVCLGIYKLIKLRLESTLPHPWWEVGTGHIFWKRTHSQTVMPYLHHFTFKEASIYLPLRGGRNESWWDRMMLCCSCNHYMAASESDAGFSEVLCIPRQHPRYGTDNNLDVYSECFEEF